MPTLVTGAAGFIGSNLVKRLRRTKPDQRIVSLDALTYAGSLLNLRELDGDDGHVFVRADIADADLVNDVFATYDIDGVIHLAAESHVDRSIVDPLRFLQTNVLGTGVLLDAATRHMDAGNTMRFHHVSTDEVFGELGDEGSFDESTPYAPRSPYSASKASSDHLVRAWGETYGLPIVITNCTNNYGPFQFPEKLIPVVILRALAGTPVPLYGSGSNVRDWLHVDDHCEALELVFYEGQIGETYCIGGREEMSNLDLVTMVLDIVDEEVDHSVGTSRELIEFVDDRPGHDQRYAMAIDHLNETLGWRPRTDLRDGLRQTVRWYLSHLDWCDAIKNEDQRAFEGAWYTSRGGGE